jgi:hypothetical protein
MSHPALDVTGSQDVGSSHSQFTVPFAPDASDVAAVDVLVAVLQAAAAIETARTAAKAARVFRAASGRMRIDGLLSRDDGHRHAFVGGYIQRCHCKSYKNDWSTRN